MRPVASFTLHAILAACLAALAASSAAAAPPFSLVISSFKNAGGNYSQGHREEIAVLSYSFGNNQAARKDPGQHGEWIADVERPAEQSAYAPANTKYSNIKLSRGADSRSGGSNELRTEDSAGSAAKERQAGSKEMMAEQEKERAGFSGRGLDIARVDGQLAKPADKGSVWIRVASPWAACRVGARYPSLELGGGTQAYSFEDAVITGCTPQDASFDYAKVSVRGWDPRPKQQ